MTTTSQALAVGEAPTEKYGKWGAIPSVAPADPDTMFAMFVGEPGVGKTSLELSNPNALILHCDPTSLPINRKCKPQAMVFPLFAPKTGRFTDANGNPVILTWDVVEEFVTDICNDVAAGVDVPQTIVIDSMSTYFELAAMKVCDEMGVSALAYTDARKSYPKVYALILASFNRLRTAGRGVHLLTHIVNKSVDLGETAGIMKYVISGFPASFYGQLHQRCDFVLAVTVATTKVAKPKPGAKPMDNGHYKPRDLIFVPSTVHRLAHRDPSLDGITKLHVPLPDPWDIPAENPWAAFKKAYASCV